MSEGDKDERFYRDTGAKATGKVIDTSFALILIIAGGEIARFQMLEDSFATSAAARASAL
jgi:uncharacterized protein